MDLKSIMVLRKVFVYCSCFFRIFCKKENLADLSINSNQPNSPYDSCEVWRFRRCCQAIQRNFNPHTSCEVWLVFLQFIQIIKNFNPHTSCEVWPLYFVQIRATPYKRRTFIKSQTDFLLIYSSIFTKNNREPNGIFKLLKLRAHIIRTPSLS